MESPTKPPAFPPTGSPAFPVRGTQIRADDSRERYRQKIARITLDSMVQFVGLLDAQGTVLEINQVALDAVGITLADVEGKPFWTTFWWQVSEEINATLRGLIARAAQGEFVRWDTPIFGRAGGKETIIIDASLCPVTDEEGNVVFICAEGRDITEKKAQERELAQKNVELQGLLERIRELDEIKTQFFANVSHELRTPLALIIGPAERLLNPNSALSADEQRATAQVVVRNARMLLKHVNDLLDVSKLEAKKMKLELQDTDVAALVRFMASHFDVLASERSVDLRVEAPASAIAAVDAEKLQRVLMNLLSNAFKFTPAGATVRCRLTADGHDLVLAVEDSGPGVAPTLRKAIFERFRQGDGGVNREVSGTGLGLAIAQEFVEMHQGTITVRDSDLGGALFRVDVPARRLSASGAVAAPQAPDRGTLDGLIEELRPAVATTDATAAGHVPSGARPIVLVVEDNPDMNRFVAQCLAPEHDVVSAFDGQQGLEKALALHPTLIVSDIMMPRVSGVEMITRLRQRPEMAETPILLLSAKADEDLKNRLLEDGVQDFVVKPFTERDLLARVRNLIAVKESRDALRVADRRKDEFLATLAHELRNPLAPIRHAAKISRSPGATDAQVQWAHEVIDRQVEHMARLLDDLLEVSRITRGKLELRKERLSVQESLIAAVETARPLIEQRGHTLTIDVPAATTHIDADPVRFAQIFSNLLTNAAKYTDPGGAIRVHAAVATGHVVVAVRDNGIGIAPELLPSLFEMFSQVTAAIERSEGGLGIGLALTRGLVRLHGGTIEAQSRGLGKGSAFVVSLPLPPDEPRRATVPGPITDGADAQPGRLRILVVDDNRDNADGCTMLLQMRGHDAHAAYSGPEALAAAAARAPDVVLLDIGMPGMSGYEVAPKLRAASGARKVVLVAVTGWSQAEDKRQALEAGFDHHLSKPIDLALLEALLERCRDPDA